MYLFFLIFFLNRHLLIILVTHVHVMNIYVTQLRNKHSKQSPIRFIIDIILLGNSSQENLREDILAINMDCQNIFK